MVVEQLNSTISIQVSIHVNNASTNMNGTPNKHNWIKSTLGHGNVMCTKCCMTDLEALALRCYEVCSEPDQKITVERGSEPNI